MVHQHLKPNVFRNITPTRDGSNWDGATGPMTRGSRYNPFGMSERCSVRIDAGTLSNFAIHRGEKFYPDRGMLEVDPLTDVPRPNLLAIQQLVKLGRQPCNTKNATHHRKRDHAFISVLHHTDPLTNIEGAFSSGRRSRNITASRNITNQLGSFTIARTVSG